MNYFDPSKSMNAFAAGAQIGGAMRQGETNRKLAPMVAAGDYGGAAKYAAERGDLPSAELYRTQYGEQLKGMKAEELAAAQKRAEDLARTAAGLRNVPYEQRRAALQQQMPLLQGMGIDPQALAQFDPTDQAIDGVLAQVTPLADLLKSPEYFAPTQIVGADGKPAMAQFSNSGAAPRTFDGVAPYQAPEAPADFTLGPGQVRYGANGQIIARGPEKTASNGITIGPDGTIQIGGPAGGSVFGKSGDSTGAKAFGTALEDAGTADATLALANQARAIIEGGYNSGALAPIKGEIGRVASEFGIGNPEKTADYEQFTSINNQLAAQMLKLFGGSDTERELAISIASNIGPRFSEATNKRMLNSLDQAIAVQRQKPEFIAQWTRRNGSLDAIDPQTGLGFQATWDRFLQSNLGNLAGAGNDERQVAVEGAAQGALPPDKMRRLEELRAKRDAGRLQ